MSAFAAVRDGAMTAVALFRKRASENPGNAVADFAAEVNSDDALCVWFYLNTEQRRAAEQRCESALPSSIDSWLCEAVARHLEMNPDWSVRRT